jgi:Cytochrome c554 and c-prime
MRLLSHPFRLTRFLAVLCFLSTAFASLCWPQAKNAGNGAYVGDEACRSCHAAQVESFHQTAHFLTSSQPSEKSILGKFTPGENVLKTANPNLIFQMEAKADGFYQTSVAGTAPHLSTRTERFDVVIGSGDKGQTYLFWDEDQLFQLPVSYWRDLGWVNSPGYRDGFADFERATIPRCLECHATDFKALPPPSNRYSKTGFALGIQCEKCHGPGSQHVTEEKGKRVPGAPATVLNPAHFSRERQMDLCAWCHAGHGQPAKSSFSYLPGDVLDEYIHLQKPAPNAPLDVHGNQVELLKQSRCYLSSSMTCLTCHNVHEQQHDPVAFSKRCLSCHQPNSVTFARTDHPVTSNCIDCHMPKQETDLIVFDFAGKKVKPEVRTHLIKIYPATQ